jgi:hypothetical protein
MMRGEKKIAIESPLCVIDDIGANAHKFGLIRVFFRDTLDIIVSRMNMTKSIIAMIIPDYIETLKKE